MIAVNKLTKLSLAVLFITILTSFRQGVAQTNSFYVYFLQNGKRINIADTKVKLKKQAFRIVVEYTEPVDLIVNASYKPGTYNQAKAGKLMSFIPAFSETENRESFFVNKETINLFEKKSEVWEKDKTDGKKTLKTDAGRFLAYKDINKLYSTRYKTLQSVKDVKFDLFLVFIYAEKDNEGDLQEIQREIVKIIWVDNYEEETKSYQRQTIQKEKIKKKHAERSLKAKQKLEKKEEKRLKKIEAKKQKSKKEN